MKRLLIITKNFLDQQDAQSQQSLALVNLLSSADYHIDLVIADIDGLNIDIDSNKVNIHKIPSKELTKKQDLISKVFRKIKRNLYSVIQTEWAKSATEVAADIIRGKKINAVFTVALPIDSHLVGLALKEEFQDLPWIAHFSDPWPESILPKPYSDWSIPGLNLMQKKKVQSIINLANNLTFTCIEQKQFFDRFYSMGDNYRIVSHIAPKYHQCSTKITDEIVIAYTGSLSRERVCRGLAEALGMLPIKSKISLEFYGYVHPEMVKYIDSYGASRRVKYRGWINKSELFLKTSASICYLLIDAEMDFYPFLPSKLADYSASGKPIYAITGTNSPSARLINKWSSGIISDHSSIGIYNALKKIELGNIPNGNLWEAFAPNSALNKYKSIINEES